MQDPHARKRVPLRFLVPNLVTLLALCSGVTSIRLAFEGRFEMAVGAVIVAVILDSLDGRIARMLKGASRFGAELDSLADFVNFGVAPAVLLYMWSLHELRNLGWVAALALAIAAALRLARFNVMAEDPHKPAFTKNYFTGIPAPAGAGLAMAPMYLGFLGIIDQPVDAAPYIIPYLLLVAFLMVSQIPSWSGKSMGGAVSGNKALIILTIALFTILLITAYTWEMLTALAAIYLLMLPFSMRAYKRQEMAHNASKAASSNT